jgi:hypothetical protein
MYKGCNVKVELPYASLHVVQLKYSNGTLVDIRGEVAKRTRRKTSCDKSSVVNTSDSVYQDCSIRNKLRSISFYVVRLRYSESTVTV